MKGSNDVRPTFRYSLSAAIRRYRDNVNSTEGVPDTSDQSGTGIATRSYGALQTFSASPTEMSNEHVPPEQQNLLQHDEHGPLQSTFPINVGLHDQNLDDDVDDDDEEAQQSEQADSDGLYPPNCTWTGDGDAPARADPFGNSRCNVWFRIHEIRRVIIECIDDPYSIEQMKSPKMNISVVRPLVNRFYNTQDLSVVFCLLINRTQFIREQSYASHHQTVNLTRALLCELVAEKVLRRYNENNRGPLGLLKLANILVAGFEPFQGAPEEVLELDPYGSSSTFHRKGRSYGRKITALEIAIVSESKSLLASSACQKVVDAIYHGRVVYSPNSFIDIIPDHWKRRPISLYDPRRAPLLNQYRMIVPRTRNLIEVIQFVILLVLYIIVMTGREEWQTTKYDAMEAIFDIYASGWVLDQIASILEHGWHVYTQNLWSFLDTIFMAQFMLYLGLRMHGLRVDHATDFDNQPFGRTALDVLSCAAPILVPRLAFNVMSDNMLLLSLRAMMGDFVTLTALAIWCFGGFLFSLKWLHDGVHEPETIGKWMIWIWFGLDGTGIDQAPDFHWLLGPMLMIAFAFLGNTLFLTILVSMLSNTFSLITSNAVQEIQYRRSVLTFMGVKADAIFAYLPPFNLLAFFLLLPLKFVLSPRIFHKVHVVCVKALNAPLLILITLYERRVLWKPARYRHFRPKKIDWRNPNGPRALGTTWWSKTFQLWDFSKFSAHGDIEAVFDTELRNFDAEEGGADIAPRTVRTQDDETRAPAAVQDAQTKLKSGDKKPPPATPRKQAERSNGTAWPRNGSESAADPTHSPALNHWLLRDRKDSIIDYDGAQDGIHETNARLIRLEQSMERIEGFLQQLLDNGGEDESQTQEELRIDAETEGL